MSKVRPEPMSQVIPISQVAASIKFKKPVPTKPELTAFDPSFIERLEEIEAKTQTTTLKSGRHISWFEESGTGESLPVVLCLHGVGQTKELWIQPALVPNVRLLAIDRMGHGSSSPAPKGYTLEDFVSEVGELLDNIGVVNFYVVGHSAGASCALQVAAGLGGDGNGRVLGCAAISGMCDKYHKSAPAFGSKEWNALCGGAFIEKGFGPKKGCCNSWVARTLMGMVSSSSYAAKKDEDFGFSGLYTQSERNGDGGCDRTWEAMDKDPFFVSKNIFSVLHGCNSKGSMLGDFLRLHDKWPYDCASYKGHCVIYHGDLENIKHTNGVQNHKAIPQSEFKTMEGHGHTTIMMEAPTIIQALISGQVAQQVY